MSFMSVEAKPTVQGRCSRLCPHADAHSSAHTERERATEKQESARWPQTFQI